MTIDDLLHAEKNQQLLKTLDAERYAYLYDLLLKNSVLFHKQPWVIENVVSCIQDTRRKVDEVKLQCTVLLAIGRYADSHSIVSFDELLQGFNRFKDNKVALVALTQFYAKCADCIIEPLLDQSILYVTDSKHGALRDELVMVMAMFYQTKRNAETAKQRQLLDVPPVNQLFDLSNQDNLRARVLLLRLLQAGVFKSTFPNTLMRWNDKDNNQVIAMSMEHYIAATRLILQQPAARSRNKVRDLTVNQQVALLRLTDELAIIGEPKPGDKQPRESLTELSKQLTRLMNNYHHRWFKSSSRVRQLSALELTIDFAIHGQDDGNNQPESRFITVLKRIYAAKLLAMDSDLATNKTRSGWLKMNRRGHSRYYDTLTKMEEAVLRHLLMDKRDFLHFQYFQEYNKRVFQFLAIKMKEALSYEIETHANPNPWRFWGKPKQDITQQREIMALLEQFIQQAPLVKVRGHDSLSINGDVLSQLMNTLQQQIIRLPGHLVTVANELLLRGESLNQHVQTNQRAVV